MDYIFGPKHPRKSEELDLKSKVPKEYLSMATSIKSDIVRMLEGKKCADIREFNKEKITLNLVCIRAVSSIGLTMSLTTTAFFCFDIMTSIYGNPITGEEGGFKKVGLHQIYVEGLVVLIAVVMLL